MFVVLRVNVFDLPNIYIFNIFIATLMFMFIVTYVEIKPPQTLRLLQGFQLMEHSRARLFLMCCKV